ncbi:MAG: rhodanese-like domain-containing protein [Candidatus Promineifilaceae bacterium]
MSENRRSLKQMMADAQAEIERISAENLLPLSEQEDVVIVDIRDIRELWRDGKIPNSVHAPRGMLEWWVDPDSPYHREVFAQKDKKYVMY